MAQFVAIEIENQQVLVAAGRQRSGRIQIFQAFALEIQHEDDDAAIGQKIRSALRKHGIGRSDAIAIVSRNSMEIRELVVPPAPENELPDLVRFKAKSEFGSLTDQWLLDYVPFEHQPEGPTQVLAAAISPEVSHQLQTIMEAAGLRLKHILFRSLATMDLVRSRLAGSQVRMIVDHTVDQTDLTVVKGTQLLATRIVRIPESYSAEQTARQLVGEIRRTIASTQRRIGSQQVEQIFVCGNREDPIYDQVSQQLDIEVEFAEPFEIAPTAPALRRELPEFTGRFAAPFGALLQLLSDEKPQVDFLNPRKKIDRSVDRKRLALYGGLAAAVFVMGIGLCWWQLSSQSAQISDLENKLTSIQQRNEGQMLGSKNIEEVMGEVDKIDDWVQDRFDWLEQLYLISDSYETPDDAIVDSLTGRFRRGTPMVTIIGRSSDIQAESALKKNLEPKYDGVVTTKSGPSGDETYSLNYEHLMELPSDRSQIIKNIDELAAEYVKNRSRFSTDETPEQEQEP